MTVIKYLTIEESHDLSEKIEKDLEKVITNTNVTIHFEPDFLSKPKAE